ncbi:MAG: ElyC/SanA/YdcF family protein [bacterium]|nr:ElyC/SanA/YdcF family protein [bacterium]
MTPICSFLARASIALMLSVLLVNAYIYAASKPYVYESAEGIPSAQAAVIPGAAVSSKGELSPIFKDRADTAVVLYRAGKVSKILVSGDNSTVSHNEVNPVRKYLLAAGIPDEDIFLDHAGFDTYSTMYRAREIFRADSLIIATQSFHLPRAIFLARSLGLKTYGLKANSEPSLSKNYVREILANEKAIIDLMVDRKPKYLGDEIPLTGDGRSTF